MIIDGWFYWVGDIRGGRVDFMNGVLLNWVAKRCFHSGADCTVVSPNVDIRMIALVIYFFFINRSPLSALELFRS